MGAMQLPNIFLTFVMGRAIAVSPASIELKALVYRGPASCEGCPESVAALLESAPTRIKVTYVGPHEDIDITAESLSQADIYVHPGGGGTLPYHLGPYLDTTDHHHHQTSIRPGST